MESIEDLLQQVQVTPELSLSKAFTNHWDEIEKTCLESIHIEATPTANLRIKQSKFGGDPWLPENFDYPHDSWGFPMPLLAQLNFEEISKLEGYPEKGILQFYISYSGIWSYGVDFRDRQCQDGFRVLYFENTIDVAFKKDLPFFSEEDRGTLPIDKFHSLHFVRKNEYVGLKDIRYEQGGCSDVQDWIKAIPKLEEELWSEAYNKFVHPGHKIGGYAYFTQEDPREDSNYILLLQIDTDEGLMWGDAGVANFFIHPEDLKNRCFSKVLYNWDCS